MIQVGDGLLVLGVIHQEWPDLAAAAKIGRSESRHEVPAAHRDHPGRASEGIPGMRVRLVDLLKEGGVDDLLACVEEQFAPFVAARGQAPGAGQLGVQVVEPLRGANVHAFSPKNQKGVPSWYSKCSGWWCMGWMLPCRFDATQRKEPVWAFRPVSGEWIE